jgi:hypothetical protein
MVSALAHDRPEGPGRLLTRGEPLPIPLGDDVWISAYGHELRFRAVTCEATHCTLDAEVRPPLGYEIFSPSFELLSLCTDERAADVQEAVRDADPSLVHFPVGGRPRPACTLRGTGLGVARYGELTPDATRIEP